ncbi:cytosine/adenosine deaminase-related metal-dependent hydrolase [Streptosporangium becharense]|uniref:Cytosine/adenosine deaminase-related metal-dependent hydrolase n=1 Tax=Streptosporangium becharense TaxID=1816182 RepID=A0A7W9MJ75_9ACTN|nr:amidohydrolase family protein [Streptosporangium becharense]MBB2913241.1 cytosine/adenosine deaminase-related metal-dependent hydrolase [Streptosporangium becharense]MBB5822224.1 cytosine/adenosine deaminase-related metal-dependent hydrolase [Streptosporangium becharense]
MRLLITDATMVDTEPHPRVLPATDMLVEDGVITEVGRGLTAAGAETLDATDRILLPGFVDTHRHVWQSVLRSIAADATLGDYLTLVLGELAPAFRAEDVHAANLWGALEALDSGVTTVYDWSHIQLTPAHTDAALDGLREAGIRAVFGYAHPAVDDGARREDEVRRVASLTASGLVTPALAAWGPVYGSLSAAAADWRLARELGLRISLHATGTGAVERLHAGGLLGSDVMFVHGNGFSDEAMKLVADSGGTASVAPVVESQMGHGHPETGRFRAFGIPTGLGVDTVTDAPGDMFSVMRAALAAARLRGEPLTAAETLRMATIGGAEVLGMADRIGSLRPGKQADLVLLRADSPAMAPACDPVAAVVTAAGTADVDAVVVAGRVVKRAGRLRHAGLPGALDRLRRSAARLS